jgi:hypothetical protein
MSNNNFTEFDKTSYFENGIPKPNVICYDSESYNLIFRSPFLSFEQKLYLAGEYAKAKIKETIDVNMIFYIFGETGSIITNKKNEMLLHNR